MKRTMYSVVLFVAITGAFLAGFWFSQRAVLKPHAPEARRVLHYVDPMNPTHTSDKPGVAPCGMPMEPVYSDDREGRQSSLPPGTVNISPERQQLMGVRVSRVEKASGTYKLRLLGRVAPDETRVYRLTAGIDGWIQQVSKVTTGSQVKKDQLLATFSAQELVLSAQQYIFALNSMDRLTESGQETPMQLNPVNSNFRQRIEKLQSLGMSAVQMEEMRRTREIPQSIKLLSPVDGFVLARNVTPEQRFEKGAELFRIAELGRVWVVADIYERDANYIRPGMTAKVKLPHQDRVFSATVTHVPPQSDPASRTLKVRLEMDNPGYLLRPDVFVDVELSIPLAQAVTVPANALLDSGLRQTVFVALGDGCFEPRAVKTGWRFGDRVEIVEGLMPGEAIAVSGIFLIDSESRMRAAGSRNHGETSKDVVCGMYVDEARSKAAGKMREYQGKTYFFCSDHCRDDFNRDPKRFTGGDLKKADKMASVVHSSENGHKYDQPRH